MGINRKGRKFWEIEFRERERVRVLVLERESDCVRGVMKKE